MGWEASQKLAVMPRDVPSPVSARFFFENVEKMRMILLSCVGPVTSNAAVGISSDFAP